ncbi:Vacuolar protein-sorting-associated protein 28 [Cladophialophora chaetospira]|uniref:Vacuolar protein sorting-associated protein 28 n=1 Tax=Cladophialophora chaetospira TaxID=386627 RepID=A0AA38X344_9EURO|nr:Vacuolar protein-sorting-associated protein 28 [Cladophialophora chaetospira]
MYTATSPRPPSTYNPVQAYAPTPHGAFPASHPLSARISLDEEVKLSSTPQERDLIDSLAEIYSIIRTLDGLEKAYIKDALPESEYADLCNKLLKQYRSILQDDSVSREFSDLDTFCARWEVECPRAKERLKVGLNSIETLTVQKQPTTGPGGGSSQQPNLSGALILTATENFITFLDALRLSMVSKSALHPLLSDVIQSVNKVTDQDFEHRGKIIQWLITLNQMKTSEELSEEQARDLAFDMEQAYNGFKGIIH